MLKIGDVVSNLFQLVLGITFKLTPNAINKSLTVSKVFLEEGFELWPYNRNGTLMAILMLGPSKADSTIEECGNKGDTIYFYGA